MEDYEKTFDAFWADIVLGPDGELNLDQVKRELHDYKMLLNEVPLVYQSVTGGVISKPNTLAREVIALADEVCEERALEYYHERTREESDA
jgi:hypothetical protein